MEMIKSKSCDIREKDFLLKIKENGHSRIAMGQGTIIQFYTKWIFAKVIITIIISRSS